MPGMASGAGLAALHRTRPPFPSGWTKLAMCPSNLTLANTLPVGQSFVWHRRWLPDSSEEYSRAVRTAEASWVVCLRQSSTDLFFTAVHPTPEATSSDKELGLTRRWLEDYFQIQQYPALPALYEDWRTRDPVFFSKIELDQRTVGVRVLRQDPWECLVAFITSTNNHISRITSLLHRFSQQFSSPLMTLDDPDGGGEKTCYYVFPRPEDIPDEGLETLLRELGFGYRAGFLQSSFETLRTKAQGPVEEELMRWRALPIDEARQELMNLKGVGRKVADCVLLMALDKPHVIPVDTHIFSIATRHPSFPSRLSKKPWSAALYEDVQSFLSEAWGPEGGWAQAVVFASDLKPQTPGTPKKVKVEPKSPTKRQTPVKRLNLELSDVADPPVLKRTRSRTKAAASVKAEVKPE